jgi:flavin reductase (DIM6/NTAB) family NADH-FMN oxidoreductase RutF
LTVAVAKDRAIESLLHSGNPFVRNVLPEGKANPIMKQFFQPFAAREDRFEESETEKAENDSLILKYALAYVECRVNNPRKCGDRWLIYAIAQTGKVLESDGITAVHHRKTGTHY